ncbi:MAG: glutathione S-transferase family protein [Pseudomonadota bacterium]
MKLYWATNTISVAAAIVLNEAGVAWDGVKIDFVTADQTKPDYLSVNPKGRVPALVTDSGTITETGAILEYLATTVAPDLVPTDPLAQARMREVMYYLAATMHVNHAHKMRGSRWATEETSFADMKAKVPETMTASAAFVEELIVGPLLFGDALTLADCWLFPISTWREGDGVDVSAFPKLSAFRDAMESRASVAALREAGILA